MNFDFDVMYCHFCRNCTYTDGIFWEKCPNCFKINVFWRRILNLSMCFVIGAALFLFWKYR